MSRVTVAEIIAPHGLKGAMKVRVADENPARFPKDRVLILEGTDCTYRVQSYRGQGLFGILQLQEMDSIEQVESLRGKFFVAEEEQLPKLEDGHYYIKDLIGMRVEDLSGKVLGTLTDVLSYAANDVYVVRTEQGEVLVPALRTIVRHVDLANGSMQLEPMKGLFDEN
uniref:ribosome maturation factor RimM n=1 Tax=Ndongobacter massiliensis TaxID=1871025 RepID=UPI000930FAED|nr:ribosome maturation factor RimM [Ndongobacter massiliensis]